MLLDMLDKAAVPELTGAMESIATHRQIFEGQGCVWAGVHVGRGACVYTHTWSIPQPYTPHPKGRMVQRQAENTLSLNAIRPGAAEFTCYDIYSLRVKKKKSACALVCVCVFVGENERQQEGKRAKKIGKRESVCLREKEWVKRHGKRARERLSAALTFPSTVPV